MQDEVEENVFEIKEVIPDDMELILKYYYGVLDAIPEERVESLLLATDYLGVCWLLWNSTLICYHQVPCDLLKLTSL